MKFFLEELQRRNVTRTAITYLAAAWLIIEVADTIFPRLGFEEAAIRSVIVVLAIGFLPALILSWFFELTTEGLQRDLSSADDDGRIARPTKITDRIIILLLLLTVALLAVDRFILDPARDTARVEEAVSEARAEADLEQDHDQSIAVLAFTDMSENGDQAYFSDGISEELLNLLSTIRSLRVISRSSAFSFKGSQATIPEIAEKLNVSYVLEGSVRKAGDNVRITAQLIDARTDAHIWSEVFDRKLDDVFAIQDEIALTIADKLQITLVGDGPSSQRIDSDAYVKFLQAQYIVHSASLGVNKGQLRLAQRLLDEVLEGAPNYIPAINALARSYYRIPKQDGMSIQENRAEIRRLVDRVIFIAPEGVSAFVWQGFFAHRTGDLETAARSYERALAIDPNYNALQRVLIGFLSDIGRYEDAVTLGDYVIKRDPACAQCVSNLAKALRATGRPKQAVEALKSIAEWQDASPEIAWALGVSYLSAGEPAQALAEFERSVIGGTRELGSLLALNDLGHTAEFEARFSRFKATSDNEGIARVYAWMGNADQAFHWINKMVEEDGADRLSLIDTELYDKIKGDSRWLSLRAQYGYDDSERSSIEFNYVLPE